MFFVFMLKVSNKKQMINAIDTLPTSPAKQRAFLLTLKNEKTDKAANKDIKIKGGKN